MAFRTRDRFVSHGSGGGAVRAWLFGIATNLIRRHHRDEERRYRALARVAARVTGVERTHGGDEAVLAVWPPARCGPRSRVRWPRCPPPSGTSCCSPLWGNSTTPRSPPRSVLRRERSDPGSAAPARRSAPPSGASTRPALTKGLEMDTDDRMIQVLLAEPPATAHAVAAARRRLMDEIEGRPLSRRGGHRRVRMWRWSLAGGGLAGVAAAGLALVMAAGPTGTGGVGPGTGPGTGPDTGRAAPPGPAADASPEQLLLGGRHPGRNRGGHRKVLARAQDHREWTAPGPDRAGAVRHHATRSDREVDGTRAGWPELDGIPGAGCASTHRRRPGAGSAPSPRIFDLGPADSASGGRVTRSTDPSPRPQPRWRGWCSPKIRAGRYAAPCARTSSGASATRPDARRAGCASEGRMWLLWPKDAPLPSQ